MTGRNDRVTRGRTTLALIMACSFLLSFAIPSQATLAQEADCTEWQAETLQIMAPAAPGGGWDGTAREMQAALQNDGIVNSVEVFNVEGAAGTIGLAELVNEHAGDDHMLMMMGLVMTGGIVLNQSPVDLSQTTPIARITTEFEVIVVPADSPYQTIDDLMAAYVEDPEAVVWAGGSAGGVDHLLVGMLAQSAGIDPTLINYVAYSGGGEALSAILGSQVTAGVSGLSEWQAQIESGELRALALSGRAEPAPDAGATPADGAATLESSIPTLQEAGIDIELANWRGFVAPPDISDEARDCMVQSIEAATESASWQDSLTRFGWTPFVLGGDDFGAYLQSENERVTALLKDLGLVD